MSLGDGANLNAKSLLLSHSLEDGVFKCDHIAIGAGASIGVSALVHYGVTMREGAILDADSYLMKGEIAPERSHWRGNTAKMMGALAPAAAEAA